MNALHLIKPIIRTESANRILGADDTRLQRVDLVFRAADLRLVGVVESA